MALPQRVGADEFDEPLSGRGRRVDAAAAGEVPLRRDSRRVSRGRGECVYCRANISNKFSNRDYIGEKWCRKDIRCVQAVLNSTKGKVGRGRTFFFAAFGRTEEEFLELLKMPESFIIKRWDAEVCGLTEDWRKGYRALSKKNKDILLGIVNSNAFNPEEWKSLPPAVCKVLDFYLYKDEDVPAVDVDKKAKFIDQFGASCTTELSSECKRLLASV